MADILNLIIMFTIVLCLFLQFNRDRRGRDRMVVDL